MKQKLKRTLSLFLALAMLLGIMGNAVTAEEPENNGNIFKSAVETGDVEVSGSTDAGNLIASAISEKQAADSAVSASENHITALEISGNTAVVDYTVDVKAELVVAIYEKANAQMLASGKSVVNSGSSSAEVIIDGDIPEYFTASAFLLDTDSHEALCNVFTTEFYTKEMQDIQDATVEDFPEEEILNLDNNSETNFAVYNEDTLTSEEGAAFNQITENSDGSYTVFNADSDFKNLAAEDTISYACDDGTVLLIKVENISVSGDTVTIRKDPNADLTDFFDYVKIEADSANPDQNVSEGARAADLENEKSYSDSKSKDFDITITDKEDPGISATFKGNVTFNYSVLVKYYLSLKKQYLCVKIDYQVKASVNLSGKIEPEPISIGKIEVPLVAGVVEVGFTPSLILKVSAEIDWYGEWNGTLGFEYDTGTGGKNLSDGPEYNKDNDHLDFIGTFYIGIEATPYVNIFEEDLCRAELKASVGLKFILTEKLLPSESDSYIHDCSICYTGELRILLNCSASLEIAKDTVGEPLEFPGIDKKLMDLYGSVDYNDYGFGLCPHARYKTEVTVEDFVSKAVPDAELSVTDEDGKIVEKITRDNKSTAVTDEEGKQDIYLLNGSYTVKAVTPDLEGSASVTVQDKETSTKIVLKKARTYCVTVHAEDETGKPVPDAVLSVEDMEETEETYSTDRDGNVTVNLVPGDHTLELRTDTMIGRKSVTVEKAPMDVTLTMEEIKYGTIHLTVVDSSGNPVGGAYVRGRDFPENLRTDSDGTVTFKLITGDYLLDIQALSLHGWNFAQSQITVKEGEQDIKVVMNKEGEETEPGETETEPGETEGSETEPEETEEPEEGRITGTVGKLTWTLKDGVLKISGSGKMPDFSAKSSSPWTGYQPIKKVIIEENVTTVGSYAFYRCSSLTSARLPEGLTSIRNNAFSECSSLASINLPEGLTLIEHSTFSGCSSLTSISLPDGLTSIGSSAFSECSSLTSISLPDSLTSIGSSAFSECSDLASISLPSELTSIGAYAFFKCSSLISIDLPDNLTSIENSAFSKCSNLTGIDLSDSLTSIESDTFYDCSSLTNINLPENLTSIGSDAFYDCSSLTSISLPDSLSSIEYRAFYGCSSLTSIDLPENLILIEHETFYDCSSLTSINLPDSLSSIEYSAFWGCNSLISINLPKNLTSIEEHTFRGCSSLVSINLPESLTSIGSGAFYGCSSLDSIDLPSALNSIENYAFYGCSSLTNIDLPENLTSIDTFYTFYGCSSLTNINLPDNLTLIGERAFSGCSSLTSIDLPENLTLIENYAFYGCNSLASISLSHGVTSIGICVFWECSGLKNIYFYGNMPSFGFDTFHGINATAYYPQNDPTWTGMENYGGEITWVPFDPSLPGSISFEESLPDSSVPVISLDEVILDNEEETLNNVGETTPPDELLPETETEEIILDVPEKPNPALSDDTVRLEEAVEDDVFIVKESVREVFTKTDGSSVDYYVANFTELTPNVSFIFVSVRDQAAPDLLAPENLLYISQVNADGEGNLSVKYRPRDGLAGITNIYGSSENHTDHIWDYGIITKETSCTEAGIKIYTCTICGETKEEAIPAVGHRYGAWIVTIEPTESSEGIRQRNCSVCGQTETEFIPRSETPDTEHVHTWNSGKITKKASCTEPGIKTYTCSVCKDTREEEIPAAGHRYGAWVVTIEPTESSEGIRQRNCSVCGQTETESIPVSETPDTEHVHAWDSGKITKKASCTEPGIKTYTCTICKDTREEEIPAAGHRYGAWVITIEPTESSEGIRQRTCSVCGQTETESIPVSETPDTEHVHTWDSGKVTKEASCTEPGIKIYTCMICGETKEEVIPATGQNPKMSLLSATITGLKTSYKYNGAVKKPKIKVTLSGKVLEKNVDYVVYITKSAAIGRKELVIQGIGDYTGSQSKNFQVVPAKAKLKKLTAGKKKVTVKVKAQKGAVYQIQYRVKGKHSWKSVISLTEKKVLKGLKRGKKYQIRIRGYAMISGKRVDGAWSKVKVSPKVK